MAANRDDRASRRYGAFIEALVRKHPSITASEEEALLQMTELPLPGELPRDPTKREKFRIAQRCIYRIRDGRPNLRPDGVLWRGRPTLLTLHQLDALLAELTERREVGTRARWGQLFISPGPVARKVFEAAELNTLVTDLVGPTARQETMGYLVYEHPGDHVSLHLDNSRFAVTVLLMLHHTWLTEPCSTLYLYPVNDTIRAVTLKPGEVLVLYGDTVVHGRSPVHRGERVYLLSVGFALEE